MEYKAKQIETNHNVSKESPVKEFVILMLSVTAIAITIFLLLGLAVDEVVDRLPQDIEQSFFSSSSEELLNENQADPRTEFVQNLLSELQSCSDVSIPLKLGILETEELNAMALPGGVILVNSGLIDKLKSENGLAFVLAHEISHFKNRDHLRKLGRGIVLGGLAAILLGSNSQLSSVLMPASTYDDAQYSQERESLADEEALNIVSCHYNNTAGSVELFQLLKLTQASGFVSHYLASHPDPSKRIADIESLIKNQLMPFNPAQIRLLPDLKKSN